MYNFVDPVLLPEVSCNAICSEGYEVTNLISPDAEKRRRGFMVYNAIKPPVEITFQFLCNISLSHVCIWPAVGSQKSCGFEVEVKGCQPKSSNGVDKFVTVGQCCFGLEPGIVFFRRNSRDSEVTAPTQFVKHRLTNKQNALSNSDCLKIKIYKTFNSTLAALERIEVWGTVSSLCTQETKETVRKLYRKRTERHVSGPSRRCVDLDRLQDCAQTDEASIENGLIIPEDFKDAITLDIMSVPMILPCGKVVDQSTIEKHEKCEASWGRPPNDPFTGKLFSNNSHPVLAPALKARIDKFLLDNADHQDLFTVARTSGRREIHSLSCSSHSAFNKNTILAASCPVNYAPVSSGDTCRSASFENSCNSKQDKPVMENTSNTPCNVTAALKMQYGNDVGDAKENASFDEMLESRLNLAVKSALANCPSFLNCNNPTKNVKTACSDCDGDQFLYVLSCKHLFCRRCLLKKAAEKTLMCSVCKFHYTCSDPCRYHV